MTGVFNVKKSDIWHALAPTFGATTVIITDMLPWIAKIRYCHLAHWHTAGLTPMTGMKDPPLDVIATPDIHTMITRIDPGSVAPDLTLVTTDIGVVAARTPIEIAPGHSTDLSTIVSHITGAPVPTTTAMTHCTADLHLIGILPKMTADLDINPKSNTTDQPADPHPPHKHHLGNIRIRDTIAHITDCPTITVHAGKHYQALIDSGATISLLRHSTYKQIEDCYKMPIQPMAAKLNTANGSPMTTLGSTTLHL